MRGISVQFGAPQWKRGMSILETVQRRARKMTKGTEYLINEERLGAVGLFGTGEEKAQGSGVGGSPSCM